MRKLRIIPRLDIKGPNLIKGIHLEGLRVVGDPQEFASKYYLQGADELLYMDTVASLYGRNNILDIVRATAQNIFIPLTVSGGIRDVENAREALRAGADKLGVNTAAVNRPELITEIAEEFGNQCVVLSIEAKKQAEGKWEAYTDNGRERTGKDVIEWVQQAIELGAGEILLTSVDMEGTKKGFDIELVKQVCEVSSVPVIASGGMGSLDDLVKLLNETDVEAVAIAKVLHYDDCSLEEIRAKLAELDIEVRHV